MKNNRLPTEEEWNRIVDEAFLSNQNHCFSENYLHKKAEMQKGFVMKKNVKTPKQHLAATLIASAAVVIAVPAAIFAFSNMMNKIINEENIQAEIRSRADKKRPGKHVLPPGGNQVLQRRGGIDADKHNDGRRHFEEQSHLVKARPVKPGDEIIGDQREPQPERNGQKPHHAVHAVQKFLHLIRILLFKGIGDLRRHNRTQGIHDHQKPPGHQHGLGVIPVFEIIAGDHAQHGAVQNGIDLNSYGRKEQAGHHPDVPKRRQQGNIHPTHVFGQLRPHGEVAHQNKESGAENILRLVAPALYEQEHETNA